MKFFLKILHALYFILYYLFNFNYKNIFPIKNEKDFLIFMLDYKHLVKLKYQFIWNLYECSNEKLTLRNCN